MKTPIITIIGIIIGWCISSFVYNPYSATEKRLIEVQRSIEPGMSLSSVIEALGDPDYRYYAGEGWPSYVSDQIPLRLSSDHNLSVFSIKGFGPQLLLVLSNSSDEVVYVASTHT